MSIKVITPEQLHQTMLNYIEMFAPAFLRANQKRMHPFRRPFVVLLHQARKPFTGSDEAALRRQDNLIRELVKVIHCCMVVKGKEDMFHSIVASHEEVFDGYMEYVLLTSANKADCMTHLWLYGF